MTLNVMSLFSGIGGLELGLERAGMRVVGQVEIDPYCRRVLAKHWPEVPRWPDVHSCVRWWRREPRPTVDLVCGGFPCQPVSVAGSQLGEDDERWLWPAMAAVVRAVRPRYVLAENVPGLLAANDGAAFDAVVGDLAACGYSVEWDCVPASAVGAPHLRDRVFIVASGVGLPSGLRWGEVADPASQGSSDRTVPRRGLGTARRLELERRLPVPDDDGERLQEQWEPVADDGGGALGWHFPQRADRWPAEPDVGRVAYGVPDRVDRLRALGNAVVPAVAQHIGGLIVEFDRLRRGVA